MTLLARRGTVAGGTQSGSPPPGPFDPWDAAYPTAVHGVWASDPLWTPPADGAAVSSMRNESGGGSLAQATGSLQPIYRAAVAAYDNRPAVEFVAAGDWLGISSFPSTVAQPFLFVVVGNTSGATGSGERLISWNAGGGSGVGDNASNAWTVSSGTSRTAGTSDASPHVVTVLVNGASSQMWIDGVSIIGPISFGSNTWTQFYLGRAGDNSSRLSGHVAFAAGYSLSTRDSGVQALEAALATYYGI